MCVGEKLGRLWLFIFDGLKAQPRQSMVLEVLEAEATQKVEEIMKSGRQKAYEGRKAGGKVKTGKQVVRGVFGQWLDDLFENAEFGAQLKATPSLISDTRYDSVAAMFGFPPQPEKRTTAHVNAVKREQSKKEE
jgi:hypothetical protein